MRRYIITLLLCMISVTLYGVDGEEYISVYELHRMMNIAEFTYNADEKVQIFTNVLARTPEHVWETYRFDGADGQYVVWAGLAWAYLHKAQTQYFDKGLSYAIQARARGYETGVAGTHPERFADALYVIGAYYETEYFSDIEKALLYFEEAWETWPYFNSLMVHVWNRKTGAVYYEPEKAIPLGLTILDNAPFSHSSIYSNCGWHHFMLKRYREAFAIWQRGLIDAEPAHPYSLALRTLMDYIEYATLEELEKTRDLITLNAAKKPAHMGNISDVTMWLRAADNPHLQFEITLREAELRGYDESVTNMLTTAVERYRRPHYAEKLGDTNMVVRLYCDRFKRHVWWWAIGEYTRLPKVHALVMSGNITDETREYYRATLEHLKNTHPRHAERLQPYLQPFAKEEKE